MSYRLPQAVNAHLLRSGLFSLVRDVEMDAAGMPEAKVREMDHIRHGWNALLDDCDEETRKSLLTGLHVALLSERRGALLPVEVQVDEGIFGFSGGGQKLRYHPEHACWQIKPGACYEKLLHEPAAELEEMLVASGVDRQSAGDRVETALLMSDKLALPAGELWGKSAVTPGLSHS